MTNCEERLRTYHISVRNWTKTGDINVSLYFCYSICGDKEYKFILDRLTKTSNHRRLYKKTEQQVTGKVLLFDMSDL